MDARNGIDQKPMWSALLRVVDAGQELVADRIDLGRLELQQSLAKGTTRLALLMLGGIFLALGWLIMMTAIVILLSPRVPVPVSLGGIGVLNGLLGAALIGVGLRRREAQALRTTPAHVSPRAEPGEIDRPRESRSETWASRDARTQPAAAR